MRRTAFALSAAVLAGAALACCGCGGEEPGSAGSTGSGTRRLVTPKDRTPVAGKYVVDLKTSMGDIVLELDGDRAPRTVETFLKYVDSGYYAGLIFHRVKAGFVIQGGGYTPQLRRAETRAPIMNEADNGLKNLKGALAMARTDLPHSATSQFFINLQDNPDLDHTSKTPAGWGYAVFGKVVEGMDVVERIGQVRVAGNEQFREACPVVPVVIESATVREPARAFQE